MVTSNLAFKEKNSIEPEVVVNESRSSGVLLRFRTLLPAGKT